MDERPFWKQRGWQVSAAFLGLVLVIGIIGIVAGPPTDSDARNSVISGPLTTALPPGATRPAGCSTDDSDQEPPSQPPGDVTWRMLNGARIPVSAAVGPRSEHGTLLWCFAHTPMGAVMAANIIPRHMSGADWRTALDQQLVAGISRDVFEAKRDSIKTGTPQYTANSPAGFMVVTYSPEAATVRLLIQHAASGFVKTDLTVVWENGDWKLQPQSGGQLYTTVTPAATPTGYVMWKA